jgi:hypothetical protein
MMYCAAEKILQILWAMASVFQPLSPLVSRKSCMLARLLLCYNQRDSKSTIYQTASYIYSTKCESFMVQSQRNTVTNGIAERNTGAPFIALNFPLNPAVTACKSLALATDLTDYLMESGVGDLPYRRVAGGQRMRPLRILYLWIAFRAGLHERSSCRFGTEVRLSIRPIQDMIT